MRRQTSSKLLAIAFLLCGAAWAQEEDGPGRGVARISLINGDVSVQRGDSGDWVAAAINAPLVVNDNLLTGAASRAEIQFDYANMLRLSSNAEVQLSELENRRYQVQVSRGTVTLSVLRDSDADIEVDTPNVSVRPVKRGEYRITVGEDGQSELTVRSGEAEVFTPRGSERLNSGHTMLVRGASSDPEFQTVRAIPEDDWDRWNENRDRSLERSQSYQYVSRDIYGADDLDAYGRWVDVPAYGWSWSPYGVGPGWAPYRYGRWAWIDWYGWNWVSYDPWGWAPYHYGRWFNYGSYGWCWYPGPMHQRHYWRPALVAFFGWGGYGGLHAGIGFGFGNVGWVPLAPYEPYYPWYGRGFYSGYRNRNYIDNSVRIVNNVNITNMYRNARVANGITGVDSGDFVRGRAGRAIQANDVNIRNTNLVRGAMPVAPGSESLRFSDREARVTNMARSSEATRFSNRRQPAAVERVPFEQQRQGMEQMVRRTYEGRGVQAPAAAGSVRASSPGGTGRGAAPARAESGNLPRSVAPERSQPGWRRIGEPASRPEASQSGNLPRVEPRGQQSTPGSDRPALRRSEEPANRGSSGDNWRRFGTPAPQSQAAPAPSRPDASPRDSGQGNIRQAPRQERQSGEPVRINPPIVRERSTPRSESPSNFTRASQPMGGRSGGAGMSRGGGGASSSGGSANGGGGRGRGR